MFVQQNISSLETRYLKCCKEHGVIPNSAVLMLLLKAVEHRKNYEKCSIEVSLDQLETNELPPLLEVFHDDHCGAVDILCERSCSMSPESILSLMNEASLKLRVVDLQNASLGKDILCDIFQAGLQCQILNVRFNEFRNLNFPGKFMQLHTLNLDFCSSLTTLDIDCFACMPNLMHISICGTKISNLWTTSAALFRLKSLVELRFQSCPCCKGTGSCPALKTERRRGPYWNTTIAAANVSHSTSSRDKSVCKNDVLINDLTLRLAQASSRDRLVDLAPSSIPGSSLSCQSSDVHKQSVGLSELHIEASHGNLEIQESESPTSVLDLEVIEESPVSAASEMCIQQNPSPICFEKHYREYMIASLPSLQVLDNFPIQQERRETAKNIFSLYFEHLPYKRHHQESVTSLLHMREMGASGMHNKSLTRKMHSSSHQRNRHFFSRSVCAAKLSSWPVLSPVFQVGTGLRPRQFEYHPSVSHLMGIGMLDGEVIVINHEQGTVLNHIPASRANCSAISLCWLNKHPSKLLAGFDNGFLRLYDINQVNAEVEDSFTSSATSYDDFQQLTSVHVNSTDEKFLASGYSRKLAVYDISSGKRTHLFTDIHQETINVAKFAHHSPHLLVTSSYDRHVKMWDIRQNPTRPCYTASSTRGNVMVCFSPDDLYLLVSAEDNEVKQLLAADGRIHTRFEIPPIGSSHNFTRSYYMNGRDYIISGSSEESVVRVCCAQTGRRLRDVHLEDSSLGSSIYVQSLRGDPFRHFHMAILAGYARPSTPCQVIKVNLLA